MKEGLVRVGYERRNMELKLAIRNAKQADLKNMVLLSAIKRENYEKINPIFWRKAENANAIQQEWFSSLLNDEQYICMVCEINSEIVGFVIGKLIEAPAVYAPSGLTLMIDDFCVNQDEAWTIVGAELLSNILVAAKEKGAAQTLVVCGEHDKGKRNFLESNQLMATSVWYTGEIQK